MKFRHKSASLLIQIIEADHIEIYRLESKRPGQGHAGELIRAVIAMFPGIWISLTVGAYGPKWMPDDQLRAFYGRCGFVPDQRTEYPSHMWIYP